MTSPRDIATSLLRTKIPTRLMIGDGEGEGTLGDLLKSADYRQHLREMIELPLELDLFTYSGSLEETIAKNRAAGIDEAIGVLLRLARSGDIGRDDKSILKTAQEELPTIIRQFGESEQESLKNVKSKNAATDAVYLHQFLTGDSGKASPNEIDEMQVISLKCITIDRLNTYVCDQMLDAIERINDLNRGHGLLPPRR